MSISEIETFYDKSLRGVTRGHVIVGGKEYEYRQWDGERMTSRLVAIDTETELATAGKIPRLAVAQAFDGEMCYLIHPDDLGQFIKTHTRSHWIGHNLAGFDFLVIYRHLGCTDRKARHEWLKAADDGRLADTMLLDQLCRLGFGAFPRERNLGQIAASWAYVNELDKKDPWRKRYGDIIGVDWQTVDSGAWTYAAKDPIATRLAFIPLRNRARVLARLNKIDQQTIKQYGLLSQRLQIRAGIALAAVHHRGICVDTARREQTERQLRDELQRLTIRLNAMPELAGVFRRDKEDNLALTPTGKPRIAQKRLRQVLEALADEHEIELKRSAKTGVVSLSREFWSQHADIAPFIATWIRLEEVAKLVQFFAKLQTDRVYPRYTTIVRTGRTSSLKPNIQQIPRSEGFREIFVPRPGFVFLAIDYAALELRTLAAECERRFGKSVLADIIREGTDPHAYTASLLLNMKLASFEQLKQTDPDNYKQSRQRAKAVNFGVPGGLGAASLSQYARLTFKVEMSEHEAGEFRERFLHEIYPEIGEYMQGDHAKILAQNLRVPVERIRNAWPDDGLLGGMKNITQGRTRKLDGSPYSERFVDGVWRKLRRFNKNPSLDEYLDHELANSDLERKLFFGTVTTVTGRPRGQATFTQRKNTPFQAMAADGAKIALWNLFRAGYKIVAFVHDEFVVELPEDAYLNSAVKRVDKICCESMQQLTGTVPIECEYTVASCWSKRAELLHDDTGKIRVWRPQELDGESSIGTVINPTVASHPRGTLSKKECIPTNSSVQRRKRNKMITQPIKWHGGKSYLAKWIHSLAPVDYTHRNIVFGGGLGEFWNWPHEGISEAVNDTYGQLTNFWRTLQDEQLFTDFCREVEAIPFSQAEWEESDPSTAVGFFVNFRQSRQGLGKDYATPTRRTRRGMNEQVSAWQTAVDGLPECCQRLRRVEIRTQHFRDFIRVYDHSKALFYCDPPYVHSTRSTGGGEYSHEMTEADHIELLDLLARISSRFMLSGYLCNLYDQAAVNNGWNRHEKEIDNKASSQKVKPKKVECVWTNY